MAKIEVDARIVAGGPGNAWYVASFPKSVTARLGTKAAVKVAGTMNGAAFRSSVFPNGDGTHHLMINRAMRDATGLGDGDKARFVLAPDTKPRVVRVPPELRAALATSPKANANFAKLAPSHKAAYVGYVTEAKKPETRARRVALAVAKLGRGRGAWE
ncbi:MAG TPA: YdeI/OmpD-associated family protein [Candidatus Thermoplasmatota archaeon]|jgi:hypothetical protein|nr:YdeI/OmpD-associated family protein [Candidatus Thermoplasmatota archaeon]